MTIREFKQIADQLPNTERFPAFFVGHGSPMNAILDNTYTRGWSAMGQNMQRPTAILSISAHWLTEGSQIHISQKPRTIHDFGGFPRELYDIRYRCPGGSSYAEEVREGIGPTMIGKDSAWGIDHGTWVVLMHMYPDANIPVFQMSLDVNRSHREHFELGRLLRPLRNKGILIMGSGNIVHNLRNITWEENAKPYDWARSFDHDAAELIRRQDNDALIAYPRLGQDAALSIPTPDHYWPLLYVLATKHDDEAVSFPIEGITYGSISMRSVKIGI